jgi:hypothetical protein
MTRSHLLIITAVLTLATGVAGALPRTQSQPDMDRDELATGAFSRMHMLYERTIFQVDVLTVEMRFDEPAQRTFQEVALGRRYSEDLAERIARTAVDAEQVFLEVRFERDVALDRWVEGVRENLGMARRWGVIDEETYRHVHEQLPRWFSSISERGFREGDRILYRTYPDRLRTVLVGVDGRTFVDQTDRGAGPRRALLGGYLAPGSDFREPLVRSLLPA